MFYIVARKVLDSFLIFENFFTAKFDRFFFVNVNLIVRSVKVRYW